MTKLQQIVKKAKEIRKAHPKKYAKWTDYIKAASKSLAGLDSVKRSGNKTTVNYTRHKVATNKKAAPKKTVQAKLFGVKKSAPKKKAATHKDTKSHNVKISVMSGIGSVHVVKPNLSTKKISYYGIWCEEISGKKYFAGNHGKPSIMTKSEALKIKKSIDVNNKSVKFFKKVLIKKVI
jgi:hypothetical protein